MSIFDEAGKEFSKKKKKEKLPPAEKKSLGEPVSDDEIKGLFKKVYSYHDEVERMLEEAYDKSGLNPKQISDFLENPSNLSPGMYQMAQEQKEKISQEIEVMVNPEAPTKKKKVKKKSKSDKSRKGKTLGARKRWLQM